MKIALIGNPNSGKTTLFNAITGKIEHVGNWPGVTVEKKEGNVKKGLNKSSKELTVVDLPGTYSLAPYTSEESITKDFVTGEKPDVIINVVDSTNLSRSLFLTTQLMELNIPIVLALNKSDLTIKNKDDIDVDRLAKILDCSVIQTISTRSKNNGLEELIRTAMHVVEYKKMHKRPEIKTRKSDTKDEESKKRFAYVNNIVHKVQKKGLSVNEKKIQDKIDSVVAHKWLGIPIFAAIMFVVFSITQSWLGPLLGEGLMELFEAFGEFVEGGLEETVNPVVLSLLVDGIINGVGAVLGFLPLIMLLFFFLALLEDCGYMARVAIVMDRFFKKIGLSGRSIIPMIVGIGCAIPGVMATRTIKNERQRRTTAMLTPFMPCGAKLPIIALFAGLFFSDSPWVGTSMYFLGIAVIIAGGIIIKKITGDNSKGAYFIMELPEYRIPSVKRAIISMFDRAKHFIIKAGTIILVCNAAVHILQTFDWNFQVVEEGMAHTSILASIATPAAILFIPLGFGIWQFAAAAITGFIAKENVVATLAVCFSLTSFIDVEEFELIAGAGEVATVFGITSIAALSFMIFNLFTPPCFAAIGAMNTEMESKKWLLGGVAFQLGTGYVLSFFVYQIGSLITTGSVGAGFLGGLIAVSAMIGVVIYLIKKGSKVEVPELSRAE